ncbi:glycosyltransferase family 39 protein [Egicoccus sp. AB-alg6-2]|uniref:glycosyltransferase family 39 protein n=1 Tax=Egicoccus sp. AB-alg6-2 TaxID=3242692 RepID=UPI00359E9A5D
MTATLQPAPPLAPYRRPTWQEAVAGYLPERHRERGERWAQHLPVALFALLGALLSLRLGRTAFIDEALYVNAGQDYLTSWRFGTPAPDHARVFSGSPVFYPVIAATLDAVGGLRLVRLFSTLLILVSTFSLAGTARVFFGFRASVFAAGAFALSAPVVFMGALGTYDALCLCLLALALWAGATRHGWSSAIVCGLLLGIAPIAKYAGLVFVPVVWALVALAPTGGNAQQRVVTRAHGRALVAALTSTTLVLGAFLLFADEQVRQGIAFTTAVRQTMTPTSPEVLTAMLLVNVGLVALFALAGAVSLRRSPRMVLVALAMLGAAAILPAAQFHMGEGVSFDKHTGYSALFLAPLAGVALERLSRRTFRLGPPLLVIALVLAFGGVRSGMLHREWPDVGPIVERIERNPVPGVYLSSSADVFKYYTRRDHPQIVWDTTFELYALGPDTIRRVVADGHYTTVVLRSSSTSSPDQDAGQTVLLNALDASPDYRRLRPIPVDPWGGDLWLVFHRRGAETATTADASPSASVSPPVAAPGSGRSSEPMPPTAAGERAGDEARQADDGSRAASSGVEPADDDASESAAVDTEAASNELEAAQAAEADVAEALLEGLRRGHRGERVRVWQSHLKQWDADALPKFGVDGIFGAETEVWTERYLAR